MTDSGRVDGHKGFPARADGVPFAEIGGLGLRLLHGDCPMPVAVLRAAAIAHNGDWMRRFTALAGVQLCPHGKTTMSPELFARQAADGVWGMTAATAHHVRLYRRWGVRRILLANQLVAPGDIALILDALARDADWEFHLLADSIEGVTRLADAAAARGIAGRINLLVEVGAPGGRTGVRDLAGGMAVAQAIHARRDMLMLRGVEAFEGIYPADPDGAAATDTLLDRVAALAHAIHEAGMFAPGEIVLTAGGSALFDLCARRLGALRLDGRESVVIRSGCYISHDHGVYARAIAAVRERMPAIAALGEGPRAALEVWAVVQSAPEPGRVIASLGKRDIGQDAEMPIPSFWFRPGLHEAPVAMPAGHRVTTLFDQHAYVDGPAGLAIGDLLGFGVSHPCTTFDKWRAILLVDEDYVATGAVTTAF